MSVKRSKKPPRKRQPRKPLIDTPARWKRIEKTYGLTRDSYMLLLSEQQGACFICRRTPEEIRPRRHLAVDHDHGTGRVRGLLCFNCNHKLLGHMLKDDPNMALRAHEYLTRTTNYGHVPI